MSRLPAIGVVTVHAATVRSSCAAPATLARSNKYVASDWTNCTSEQSGQSCSYETPAVYGALTSAWPPLSPPARALIPVRPLTSTGVLLSVVVVPLPSSPSVLFPQAHTVPPDFRA